MGMGRTGVGKAKAYKWRSGEEVVYKNHLKQAVALVRSRVKVCEQCGLTFYQLTQNRRYCGEQCAAEANRCKGRERVARHRKKEHTLDNNNNNNNNNGVIII